MATLLMFVASFEASGTIPLWIAWFLVNQTKSHRTAAKIWNKCESARGIPKVTWGVIIPLIQSKRLRKDHFKESRGQWDNLQDILAKKKLKKRWERKSSSTLHKGHTKWEWGMGKTAFNLILKGTMSQAIFQRNSFNLSLRLIFQKSLH